MKQRPRNTIDALILSAASYGKFGATKAALARDLSLTYARVNEYCDDLVQRALLRYDSVTRTYHVTPSGREMLRLTEELAEHYSPVEDLMTRYRSRVETGVMEAREQSRRMLKGTCDASKERLSVIAASPLLLMEQTMVHMDECLVQLLPC
jgi:predicted transcriptional regulator